MADPDMVIIVGSDFTYGNHERFVYPAKHP